MLKYRSLSVLVVFSAFIMCGAFGRTEKPKPAAILVAGTGPTESLQPALDGIVDTLSSAGLAAKVFSSDPKSRTVAVEEAKNAGATSLLYLDVHQVPKQRGRITLQCFVDGKEVWQEEVKGAHFALSLDKELSGMIKEINEKVRKRIGGPGLPK
jgi:hypothetical protein